MNKYILLVVLYGFAVIAYAVNPRKMRLQPGFQPLPVTATQQPPPLVPVPPAVVQLVPMWQPLPVVGGVPVVVPVQPAVFPQFQQTQQLSAAELVALMVLTGELESLPE